MVDAARKLKKVVQVGTQRRSTPHLIEARDRIIREGKLGKIGLVEIYCYYHMRTEQHRRPTPRRPMNLDYEMWTGPAPIRPYNPIVHPRSWRAFMEYGNGIVGDMCVHMLDMVRWMMGLGWPTSVASTGGILIDKAEPGQHPRHPGSHVRLRRPQDHLAAPELGRVRPTRRIPGARPSMATRAPSRPASTATTSSPDGGDNGKPVHVDVKYELDEYPRGQDREGPGKARRPGDPRPHARPAQACIASRAGQAGRRHRGRPHLHRLVHPRQQRPETWPDPGLRPGRPQGHRRRRGHPPPRPAPTEAPWAPPGARQDREDRTGWVEPSARPTRHLFQGCWRIPRPSRYDTRCEDAWRRSRIRRDRLDGASFDVAMIAVATLWACPPRVRRRGPTARSTFERDVMPILTRAGCNAGACHGKARGQNGFQLSLLFGFDADSDHAAIASEARGRRVFPAAPDRSLLLLKAAARRCPTAAAKSSRSASPVLRHRPARLDQATGMRRTPSRRSHPGPDRRRARGNGPWLGRRRASTLRVTADRL